MPAERQPGPAGLSASRDVTVPGLWRQPGTWLLVLAGAVILLGVAHRHPTTVALGATFAALIAAAYLWARLAVQGLRVERSFRDRLFTDEPLIVTWRISRRLLVSLVFARFSETCSVQRGPGHSGHLPSLARLGWEQELVFVFANERGRGLFDVGPGFIEGGDPAGLFCLRRELPALRRAVRVYPKPLPESVLPFVRANPLNVATHRHLHAAGDDLDFRGTREFRPGDNPRRIHWRATARAGRLTVAEYDRAIRLDVSIVLDLSTQARLGTGGHSTSEYGIRIAGTLAAYALSRGHRVQVLAAQGSVVIGTGLGFGHAHLLHVFDELAVWRPVGALSLAAVVDQASRAHRVPVGGVCVLVAPSRVLLLDDTALAFATLERTQTGIWALALRESQFVALTTGQTLDESEADVARRHAGHLVVQGVDVQFVDAGGAASPAELLATGALAGRRAAPELARPKTTAAAHRGEGVANEATATGATPGV